MKTKILVVVAVLLLGVGIISYHYAHLPLRYVIIEAHSSTGQFAGGYDWTPAKYVIKYGDVLIAAQCSLFVDKTAPLHQVPCNDKNPFIPVGKPLKLVRFGNTLCWMDDHKVKNQNQGEAVCLLVLSERLAKGENN